MNSIYYFGLMIRLFAIALFIYGVGRLEFVISYTTYSEASPGPGMLFSLSSSVLPVLISVILWFFPLTFAKKILPMTEGSESSISPHSLLTVLVLSIGLYTLYYAIVDSMFWITYANIFVKDEFGSISKVLSNENKSSIVTTIIELALALILVVRAKTISYFMMKVTR